MPPSRYLEEYRFAQENIFLLKENDEFRVVIDNQLLNQERAEGLILKLDRLIAQGVSGEQRAMRSLSTSKVFAVSEELPNALGADSWVEYEKRPIAAGLRPDLFYFRRVSDDRMDANLVDATPCIVVHPWPVLAAAQVNTQVEFDRAYRSILKEPDYRGKNLLFISGLNVDISPEAGQLFPLTKFVPWAAYFQRSDGHHETWEQQELYERIKNQPLENPDQVDRKRPSTS